MFITVAKGWPPLILPISSIKLRQCRLARLRRKSAYHSSEATAGDLGAWGNGGGTRAGRAPPPAGEGSHSCSGGTARQGAKPARRGGPARRRGVCVRVCVGVEGTGFEVSDEGRLPSVMFLPGALDLALGKHANKFN